MAWYKKNETAAKIPPTKALWQVCPRCKSYIAKDEWKANNAICPVCNYHGRLGARARIAQLADAVPDQKLLSGVSLSSLPFP